MIDTVVTTFLVQLHLTLSLREISGSPELHSVALCEDDRGLSIYVGVDGQTLTFNTRLSEPVDPDFDLYPFRHALREALNDAAH